MFIQKIMLFYSLFYYFETNLIKCLLVVALLGLGLTGVGRLLHTVGPPDEGLVHKLLVLGPIVLIRPDSTHVR
jgi:hypothetical protein